MSARLPYAQARAVECHVFHGDLSSVGNFASETQSFPPTSQYQLQIDRFSRRLLGEPVPSWPIEDALQTAEIGAAILASSRKGIWIDL